MIGLMPPANLETPAPPAPPVAPPGLEARPAPGPVRRVLKSALLGGYKHSGLMACQELLRRWTCAPHMTILLFHRVTDLVPADGLTVSTDWFQEFCALMKKRYHVVPL